MKRFCIYAALVLFVAFLTAQMIYGAATPIVPIATATRAGIVKGGGVGIEIEADGTINATGETTAGISPEVFAAYTGVGGGRVTQAQLSSAVGPAGQDGAAATIAIGTTTTGAAGSSANVNNTGTTNAAILNFTIPRGATGATGATGPQGPTGATGPQGTAGGSMAWRGVWEELVEYYANDAVSYGTPASTYIAIETSTGAAPDSSPTYWSLSAEHGATGATGATGSEGPQGPQGFQGYSGAQGPQGPQGETGATGAAGPAGLDGGTLVFKGAWSAFVNYSTLDSVTYNGSSFAAKLPSLNLPPWIPPASPTTPQNDTWQMQAQRGSDGSTGATGATGATGPAGTTDHVALSNLDYEGSGHTGFEPADATIIKSGELSAETDDPATDVAASVAGVKAVQDAVDGLAVSPTKYMDGQSGRNTLAAWVADPTIDVTAALQAALNSAKRVVLDNSKKYVIESADLTIPNYAALVGGYEHVSNSSKNFTTIGSALYLKNGKRIIMKNGAQLKGVLVLRGDIAGLINNGDTDFAGTAIVSDHADNYIGYNAIIGFEYGIWNDGLQGGEPYNRPRATIENNIIDCKNGIVLADSGDTARIKGNHIWPFTSNVSNGYAYHMRSGYGIRLSNVYDWAQLSDNVVYGFAVGYSFHNVNSVSSLRDGCDAPSYSELAGARTTIGMEITGTSTEVMLVAPQIASQDRAIVVNTSPAGKTTMIDMPALWANNTNNIHVLGGNTDISGGVIRGTTIEGALPNGIVVDNAASIVRYSGTRFISLLNETVQTAGVIDSVLSSEFKSRLVGGEGQAYLTGGDSSSDSAKLYLGNGADESASHIMYTGSSGTLKAVVGSKEGWRVSTAGTGIGTASIRANLHSVGTTILGTGTAALADTLMDDNAGPQINPYLDASGNKLKFKVIYDGTAGDTGRTVQTGEIPLGQTFGTAAFTPSSDYAPASIVATAESALQPTGSGAGLTGITAAQVGAVATVNVVATMDGTTDASAIVQAAVNSLSATGGVVTIPVGKIKFSNVTLPAGVVLQGTGGKSTTLDRGTWVYVTDTTDNAIKMGSSTQIKGLNFWYPSQTKTSSTLTTYPATIKVNNYSVNMDVRDCNFGNAYHAIDAENTAAAAHASLTVADVTGFPLALGITDDNSVDVDRFTNVHWNPAAMPGYYSGDYNDTFLAGVSSTAVGMRVKKVDWPIITGYFAYGYAKGLQFTNNGDSLGVDTPIVTGGGLDSCRIGVDISGAARGVQLQNVPVTAWDWKDATFKTGVAVNADTTGDISVDGMSVWGPTSKAFNIVNAGKVVFNDLKIRDYGAYATSANPFGTVGTVTSFRLNGGFADGLSRNYARGLDISSTADNVEITGFTFKDIGATPQYPISIADGADRINIHDNKYINVAAISDSSTTANKSIILGTVTAIGATPSDNSIPTEKAVDDAITAAVLGGGSMIWPSGGAGVPNYNGSSAWGASYGAASPIPANFVAGKIDQAATATQSITYSDALTTGAPAVLTLKHATSATAANNIGTQIGFFSQNAAGTQINSAAIISRLLDATANTGDFEFYANDGSGVKKTMQLDGVGNLTVLGPSPTITATGANSGLTLNHTGQGTLRMYNTSYGTDQKYLEWLQSAGKMEMRFVNDAYSAASNIMEANRNSGAHTVKNVSFPVGAVCIGSNTCDGNGNLSVSGTISSGSTGTFSEAVTADSFLATGAGFGLNQGNTTGSAIPGGTIVSQSGTVDYEIAVASANAADRVGIVKDNIATSTVGPVIVSGNVGVLLKNSTACTRGQYVSVSSDTAGRATCSSSAPADAAAVLRFIGVAQQSVSSGTDVRVVTRLR